MKPQVAADILSQCGHKGAVKRQRPGAPSSAFAGTSICTQKPCKPKGHRLPKSHHPSEIVYSRTCRFEIHGGLPTNTLHNEANTSQLENDDSARWQRKARQTQCQPSYSSQTPHHILQSSKLLSVGAESKPCDVDLAQCPFTAGRWPRPMRGLGWHHTVPSSHHHIPASYTHDQPCLAETTPSVAPSLPSPRPQSICTCSSRHGAATWKGANLGGKALNSRGPQHNHCMA